jgi:hypothetical protein
MVFERGTRSDAKYHNHLRSLSLLLRMLLSHTLCPQKQLHEERVAALLTDRQLRVQEEERQRSNLMVQVSCLSNPSCLQQCI